MTNNLVAHTTGAGYWQEGAGTLRARSQESHEHLVAHTLRADGFDASEDGTGRGTPLVPVAFPSKFSNQGIETTDLAPTLDGTTVMAVAFGWNKSASQTLQIGETTDALHSSPTSNPAVAYIVNAAESCATQSHARPSDVARCLDSTGSFANAQGGTVVAQTSGCLQHKGLAASGNEAGTLIRQAVGVRRLTPREAERLQGFPDDFTLVPYRGKIAADGNRYKSLGNSMAVPVMRWIGERIQMVDALSRFPLGSPTP